MKQTNSRKSAAERARIRRLRATYRKRMLIVGVIFFIIGLVLGALVHSWYTGRRDEPQAAAATPLPAETGNIFGTGPDEGGDVNGGFAVDEAPEAEPEPEITAEPEPEITAEPEPTEVPRPVIHVPVTEEPTEAPAQPAIQVPQTEEGQPAEAEAEQPAEAEAEKPAETEAEQPAEPETEAQAVAGEPAGAEGEAQADAEPGVTAEPTDAPTPTPVPDLGSDDVEEFDPESGEVPVEYTLDQETLSNPNWEEELNRDPQVVAIVPYGESYTYTTQVKMDGSARVAADADPFETLSFTQTMKEYMRPSDFADRYSTEYRLSGDEAGASFELTLNDYVGTSVIIPQNVVDVSLCSASGNTVERGYQLMDKAMGGNYDVAVKSGEPKTLFKRYAYSNVGEEMEYLVVTTYTNGRQDIILFELEGEEPIEPPIVYPTIQRGLKSDDVKNMQERLIELGYLTGKADGDFGPATEKAVKEAQEAFGMEVNGTADNAFQQKLYEGMETKPTPAGQQTETDE